MNYKFNFTVDLRSFFPNARDQGPRETCTAFAVTACHEQHREWDTELSEEFLFSCSKYLHGNFDESGVSIISAFEAIQHWGQAQESVFPYSKTTRLPYNFNNIEEKIFSNALPRKIASYQSNKMSIKEIESNLNNERSVMTGVEVHPPFYMPESNVFIDVPDNEELHGNHAILIVGYGQKDDGKKFFIIRNSWGTKWGDSGYAYISYEYFNKYELGTWIIPKEALN